MRIWVIETTIKAYTFLLPIFWIALAVVVFVLLPFGIWKKTRSLAAFGLIVSSYIFGVTTWFFGTAITFLSFGWLGLFIGLIVIGVGVIPLGIAGSFFKLGMHDMGLSLTVMLLITLGTRWAGVSLANRNAGGSQETEGNNHSRKQNPEKNKEENIRSTMATGFGTNLSIKPGMPDFLKRDPISVFGTDKYILFVLEDVPPLLVERFSGKKPPIQYLFTLVVFEIATRNPVMYVTLEAGFLGTICLCGFLPSANNWVHVNFGDGSAYMDLAAFEKVAIETVSKRMGIDEATIKRMKKKNGG